MPGFRGTPVRLLCLSEDSPAWFLLCEVSVAAYIPNETRQLASYSGDDFRLRLACGRKPAIPLAQSSLGLPADSFDLLRKVLDPHPVAVLLSGRQTIGPGRFNKHGACLGIASFRNRPTPRSRSARCFRRNQPKPPHEMLWRLEPSEVTDLGNKRRCNHQTNATQGLQGLHKRRH
jgi:hypothetical protein